MEYSSPTDVLQAYRQATDVAKHSQNLDDEINAYRRVIELGQNHDNIAPDDLLKYNMIMYWAYNNVADALFTKSYNNALDSSDSKDFSESLEYYQRGLKFARDNLEKIAVLNRMAESYLHAGDEKGLCEIKQKIFANLNKEDKRRAYNDLADRLKNSSLAAEMYEEALNFVNDEKVSLNEKCRHTIKICERLEAIYLQKNDHQNYLRILKLKGNTENVLKTCVKKGGCKF